MGGGRNAQVKKASITVKSRASRSTLAVGKAHSRVQNLAFTDAELLLQALSLPLPVANIFVIPCLTTAFVVNGCGALSRQSLVRALALTSAAQGSCGTCIDQLVPVCSLADGGCG